MHLLENVDNFTRRLYSTATYKQLGSAVFCTLSAVAISTIGFISVCVLLLLCHVHECCFVANEQMCVDKCVVNEI